MGRLKIDASNHAHMLQVLTGVSIVGGILYGLYYGIFLYKQTFSLQILALDGLLGGLGLWMGYIIGVRILKRFGYNACYKISFGIMATTAFLTAIIANNVTDWFMLLAVLKTLPAGLFASATDTIMVRESTKPARQSFLQKKLALEFGAAVVLPPLVGLLVSSHNGYRIAFILSGMMYVLALFIPLRLEKPDVTLSVKDMLKIFKRPHYKEHAANRTAAAGFNQLNGFVGMLVPFLLLNNETSVGLLSSLIALVAAGVSVYATKLKPQRRISMGYVAYCIRSITSVSFVLIWTAPVMILWQLVSKLVTPLHDPLQQSIDFDNDSLILGEDVKQQALQINLLNNSLVFFGSTMAYGALMYIASAAQNNQAYVLQSLIVGFALWRMINLSVAVWINRRIGQRRLSHSLQPAEA